MTRIEVSRHIAADPTSVALLLAEPVSEHAHERAIVTAPPRRAGVGFTANVEVVDSPGQPVAGVLVIEPATDEGCDVRLVVVASGTSGRSIERSATAFLSHLGSRARARSHAA